MSKNKLTLTYSGEYNYPKDDLKRIEHIYDYAIFVKATIVRHKILHLFML